VAGEVRLTLLDALKLAERHDPSLASARLDVEAGDAQVREAISAALPKISADGTVMRHMVVPTTFFPFSMSKDDTGGISLGGPERMAMAPPNDVTASLSMQQPLWLAGKIRLGINAAKTYRRIARDALSGSRAGLKSDVIREYYGLALSREVIKVTQEAYDQTARHAETVRRMLEVGMASEFDYLRAQVEVKSLEPELARARQMEGLAKTAFCNRLGLDPYDTLILVDELARPVEPPEIPELKPVYSIALGVRPEFRVIDLREEMDKINIKAEKRSIYWPNFVFGLNYRRQFQEKSFSDMPDAVWPETFTWTVNIQIPLFDGFATSAKIQNARIGLRKTGLERLRLEQGVRLEVTQALSELRRSFDQVVSQKAALELAEKALEISRTRYEQGVGTELEVLDAQLAHHRASLGYLQGLYDLRVARAEYARIVGNDDDFDAVR